jgi:hypothetical protein
MPIKMKSSSREPPTLMKKPESVSSRIRICPRSEGADPVMEDLAGPVIVINRGVEKALAIGGPGAATAGVLDEVGSILARSKDPAP